MSDLSAAQLLSIRAVLEKLKAFFASSSVHLGAADTRVYFIDPLLMALGYTTHADLVREQYILDSQDKLDYVLRIDGKPRVGITTHPIDHLLILVDAGQVVQYCSILGIEWSVLTNGVQWWLYHQFAKTDLNGMLVFKLDLLNWHTDAEFLALATKLLSLSRQSFLDASLASAPIPSAAGLAATHAQELSRARTQQRQDEFTPEKISHAIQSARLSVQEQLKPQILAALDTYPPAAAVAAVEAIDWNLFFLDTITLRDTLKKLSFKPEDIRKIMASSDWAINLDQDPLGFSRMDVPNATRQAWVYLRDQGIRPLPQTRFSKVIHTLRPRRWRR